MSDPIFTNWEETRGNVTIQCSEYTVSAATSGQDPLMESLFEIQVCLAKQTNGSVKWAVRRLGSCLDFNGQWHHEMQPSSRTEEWVYAHRFSLSTALMLAQKAAPLLTVNGYRPDGTRA